jgi:hypothetical protein
MPLYTYRILGSDGSPTGETVEHLCRVSERVDELVDPETGERAVRQGVELIADTPNRWGDSSAHYDRNLRSWVRGARDIDRICKERDLVRVSDLGGKHFAADSRQRAVEHEEKIGAHFEEGERIAEEVGVPVDFDENNPRHIRAAGEAQRRWLPAKPLLAGEVGVDSCQ